MTPPGDPPGLISPSRLYLVVGSLAGLLLVFTVPLFQGEIEHEHFYRVWHLAEGRLTAPEGWDKLAAREKAGEEITPFVVIWKGDDGFCVPLDSDCAVALYAAPSQREIEEIAEWITDEYEEASGW